MNRLQSMLAAGAITALSATSLGAFSVAQGVFEDGDDAANLQQEAQLATSTSTSAAGDVSPFASPDGHRSSGPHDTVEDSGRGDSSRGADDTQADDSRGRSDDDDDDDDDRSGSNSGRDDDDDDDYRRHDDNDERRHDDDDDDDDDRRHDDDDDDDRNGRDDDD